MNRSRHIGVGMSELAGSFGVGVRVSSEKVYFFSLWWGDGTGSKRSASLETDTSEQKPKRTHQLVLVLM